MKSAGGTSFAGDFLVAAALGDDKFELVVVDVSGKGVEAGSRSLFLSGAFNGIVSARCRPSGSCPPPTTT